LDFFERQEQARRTTRWLVFWYALAATLDCPLPPGFAALDPKSWAG